MSEAWEYGTWDSAEVQRRGVVGSGVLQTGFGDESLVLIVRGFAWSLLVDLYTYDTYSYTESPIRERMQGDICGAGRFGLGFFAHLI